MDQQNLIDHFIYNNGKSEYKLYSTGKGFKSVITDFPRTLRNGTKIDAYTTERRHNTLSAALNSKRRPDQIIVTEVVKQS